VVCGCGLLGDVWYIGCCMVCGVSCVGIFRVRVVLLSFECGVFRV